MLNSSTVVLRNFLWTDENKVELFGKRHKMPCIGSDLLPQGLDSLLSSTKKKKKELPSLFEHFAGVYKAIYLPI